jgi:Trk K+ transport system NAD-binding subunit
VSGEAHDERYREQGDGHADDDAQITQRLIEEGDDWADLLVRDLSLPDNTLIANVTKGDGTSVTPKGWTKIHPGDVVTLITWE